MGAQQSLFNKQQSRQLVVFREHCLVHRSDLMSKIYRSSHSYPYPRTHSLVVVPSTRPPASEEEEPNRSMIIPKQRPPLNRAIPTIPESKSNESIVTQSSERRDDYIADGAPSSSRHHEIRAQHCSSSSTFNKVDLKARKSSLEDRSVVIENKLAQNLSAKTGMSVTTKNECACETPKSPLMSVAHSVRTRLTKLSNRFSRVDPRQGIRSSYSLSSMRQRSSDNSGGCETKDSILESRLFKKSASMESRPTPCSTSSDSIKSSIPVRTPTMPIAPSVYTSDRSNTISPKEIKVISKAKSRSIVDPKTLKLRATVLVGGTVPCPHVEGATATSPNQREAENNENNSTGIRQRSSPVSPVRPKEEEVVQCSPTTMMHPAGTQPKPATSGVAIPSTRVSSKTTTTTISGRSSNKNDAKTIQSKTKAVKNNTVEKIAEKDEKPSKRLANEEPRRTNDLIKKVERSFIPLMTSIPRRNDVRSLRRSTKNSKAPLAEFESSRIENSPAVELPPLSFDRISNSPNRRCRLAMRAEDGPATIAEESIVTVTESFSNTAVQNNVVPVSREDWNGNIEVTVARTTISEDSQASCTSNHNEGWPLTSPAASSAETNRGLIDDEIKDQPLLIGSGFTPVDEFGPSSHWRRSLEMSEAVSTNQASSQTSPVHMISSLNMASSSCMATSGPLSSPQNDVDSRSELDSVEEQLSNLTVCNSANRARARRSPVGADIDGDQFVATTTTQPGPSYPKQQKVDRATGGPVAFPDIASYECACRDVVSIKNQLLELQRIINNSAAADQLRDAAAEQPNGISVERLLRENDALRKELAEKDHIINTLRAQMTLN